jgi:hypothetical protein
VKRKFSKLDLLPVLSVLSSVGPIVGDTIGELLSADPADLPSRDDLAFRLVLGLSAINIPQLDHQDCVNAEDRKALALFLAGLVLNIVRIKRGIPEDESADPVQSVWR